MSRTSNWGALLGEMIQVRLALAAAAPRKYPATLPGVPATDADVADAATRLGAPLDAQHIAVLREGNGYENGFLFGDLLSTDELGQGRNWDRASMLLGDMYEWGPAEGAPARAGIYPIHVGDDHVFVIDLAGPVTDGGHPVYWLDPAEVLDRWPNVYEFWLASMTLMKQLVEREEERARLGLN